MPKSRLLTHLRTISSAAFVSTVLTACLPAHPKDNSVPSMDYTNSLKRELGVPVVAAAALQHFDSPRAALASNGKFETPRARLVDDKQPLAAAAVDDKDVALKDIAPAPKLATPSDIISNENLAPGAEDPSRHSGVYEYRSGQGNTRDYVSPIAFGDPGRSASLWHESSGTYDLFRDQRAFRPMDLITVMVTENTQAQKQADTEVQQESGVAASITNLLGLETSVPLKNPNIRPGALINAATKNDYKGQGSAQRNGTLTAQISAMVAEVLPSGILRIEGEKIVTLDGEQEIMKISGLVRPRDINAANQVLSSQVADMRIDYFGEGTIGEVQTGGWLGRLVRKVWPF